MSESVIPTARLIPAHAGLACRLRRRLDRLTELQEAFLRLACAMICLRFVGT